MTEKIEQTLVLIKPDGLVKSLTGDVLSKLSETKLKIVGAKMVSVSRELAEKHYCKLRDQKGEKIFQEVIKYIMGEYHTKRVMALVYEGENAIQRVRDVCGVTNPEKAEPTTIRGKYGRINSSTGVFENVVHASENEEDAEREIKLWFRPDELTNTIYPFEFEKKEVDIPKWK